MSIHFLPVGLLIGCIIISLIVLSFHRSHAISYLLCGAGLLAAMLSLFNQLGRSGFDSQLFMFNGTTALLSLIILIVVAILWVQLYDWLEQLDERKEEYYLLLLLATSGGLLLIASNHFASFFISLELMSLSFVGLVAYSGQALKAQEAGVKYLVLAAVASALILMGIAIIYLQYGSLGFIDLARFNATTILPGWVTVTAIIFILAGMLFKLSLVPCHLWVADLLEGAPLPSAALLATLSKLCAFIVLWRMFSLGQWQNFTEVMQIIAAVAIASMLVGNLLGLLQNNLMRLLAFSSIAHFGYLMIILLLVSSSKNHFLGSGFATEAAVFYLTGYLFTLIGIFSVLIQMPGSKTVQDLTGLFWHKPLIAITLSLLMLSLAGIPLTIGFMGKFYLVLNAVSHHQWWLLAALVIGSVIGLFYYLRVIMTMVKSPDKQHDFAAIRLPTNALLLNYLIIFLVIGFGTFPAAFSRLIQHLSGV